MGNMYDNLGNFLYDALEKGKIPESKPSKADYNATACKNQPSQPSISLDDLPATTKKAFITLDCLPSMTLEEIKKQYRDLIKQNHPDTRDAPEINVPVQELVNAMEEIEKYFKNN